MGQKTYCRATTSVRGTKSTPLNDLAKISA
jgi:hypothetical protein